MNEKKILTVVLIAAFLVRLFSAFIIPIYEKPDERSHFEYVEFFLENKELPVQTADKIHAEFFQPPVYYILGSFVLAYSKVFANDVLYNILAMRLFSIFFSMLTLVVIYKTAKLIFSDKRIIFGILIFAAFLPSHINMNSAVTNANLGDFLSALIIFLVIKTLKHENAKNMLLLGLTAGIGMISRLSVIPSILTIPLGYLIRTYPMVKRAVKPIVVIAFIAVIISGWNLLRNFLLYGDFLGMNAFKLASPPDDITVDLLFVVRLLGWTFITFWASFGRTNNIFLGNLNSSLGIAVFVISYLALLLVSLFALYRLFLMKQKKNISKIQKQSLLIFAFQIAFMVFTFITFNLSDFQPQGRYFFPAMTAISTFFTFGVFSSFNQKNWGKVLIIYIASFAFINLVSFVSIIKFY